MAYLDDPAIQAMLAQKRSPMSFVSGLGRSRMDEIDAARSMQGQDAMFQQVQTAEAQRKPKGYLDQMYDDIDPAYFVDQATGMPQNENISNFTNALQPERSVGSNYKPFEQFEKEERLRAELRLLAQNDPTQKPAAPSAVSGWDDAMQPAIAGVAEYNQGGGMFSSQGSENNKLADIFQSIATRQPAYDSAGVDTQNSLRALGVEDAGTSVGQLRGSKKKFPTTPLPQAKPAGEKKSIIPTKATASTGATMDINTYATKVRMNARAAGVPEPSNEEIQAKYTEKYQKRG
jgi:hypothetical protein